VNLTDDVIISAINQAQDHDSHGEQNPDDQNKQNEIDVETSPKTKPMEERDAIRKEESKKELEQGWKIETHKEDGYNEGESEEPRLRAREKFNQRAEKEREYRGKESLWKEREEEYEKTIGTYKRLTEDFQKDPIAYLERTDPTAFERWVKRNIEKIDNIGQNKNIISGENGKYNELKKEIENLSKIIQQQQESVQQTAGQTEYRHFMAEIDRILSNKQFDSIKEYSNEYECLTGNKTDFHKVAENIWIDYRKRYPHAQPLTPYEICEIMLDDSESNLTRFRKKYIPAAETKSKDSAGQNRNGKDNTAGKTTLTNDMVSSSASAGNKDWYEEGLSKDEIFRRVATGIEFKGND